MSANHLSLIYEHVSRTFLQYMMFLFLVIMLAGCATRPFDPIDSSLYPSGTVYTYQPLNPTTVWIRDRTKDEIKDGYLDGDQTSYEFNRAMLRDLDTETVRISLDSLSGNVKLNAGIVGTSVEGQSYVLIVDYIKYITSSTLVSRTYITNDAQGKEVEKSFNGTVPMYTGIGLRIRAEFKAQKSGLNISGLPALAVAASTNGISGRLTIQTMGITGAEVTGLIPLISDISVTSIQSAVQAVGAIKAKIYEESTTVYPKIVGFESPGRDPALIRAITEFLYATEVWICPTVIQHPQDSSKTIYYIDWSEPPEK